MTMLSALIRTMMWVSDCHFLLFLLNCVLQAIYLTFAFYVSCRTQNHKGLGECLKFKNVNL